MTLAQLPFSSDPKPLRWTVDAYDRMAAAGLFNQARVELIEGRIIQMAAQLEPHVAGVSLAGKVLESAFGGGYWVRRQNPLRFGSRSKPEPDVAVVPGNEGDYIDIGTPSTALLVVEVSDSSLRYDRGRKAALYAKHAIADYWIVNLVERQLEVHRDPVPNPAGRFKFRYAQIQVLKPGDAIAPISIDSPVSVSSLMPRLPQKQMPTTD
ncbi:MAG TPA: Uma2 family endonuclease [Tepidisphaeraceae bacterium]|nr:Uma2 family endonuclease [Tepidisphaeraceae bacterium]